MAPPQSPGSQRKDASDIEAPVSPNTLSPAWMINDHFPIVAPAETLLEATFHPLDTQAAPEPTSHMQLEQNYI
ncbi:rCG38573 [Rattus norvegicus]|uniref:RCG38573 n=1 Tax=Rattus norvegicus TaxID=10116 RepID=A6KME7_RAT|nr:rCG38573 [Rattus norvegicus]